MAGQVPSCCGRPAAPGWLSTGPAVNQAAALAPGRSRLIAPGTWLAAPAAPWPAGGLARQAPVPATTPRRPRTAVACPGQLGLECGLVLRSPPARLALLPALAEGRAEHGQAASPSAARNAAAHLRVGRVALMFVADPSRRRPDPGDCIKDPSWSARVACRLRFGRSMSRRARGGRDRLGPGRAWARTEPRRHAGAAWPSSATVPLPRLPWRGPDGHAPPGEGAAPPTRSRPLTRLLLDDCTACTASTARAASTPLLGAVIIARVRQAARRLPRRRCYCARRVPPSPRRAAGAARRWLDRWCALACRGRQRGLVVPPATSAVRPQLQHLARLVQCSAWCTGAPSPTNAQGRKPVAAETFLRLNVAMAPIRCLAACSSAVAPLGPGRQCPGPPVCVRSPPGRTSSGTLSVSREALASLRRLRPLAPASGTGRRWWLSQGAGHLLLYCGTDILSRPRSPEQPVPARWTSCWPRCRTSSPGFPAHLLQVLLERVGHSRACFWMLVLSSLSAGMHGTRHSGCVAMNNLEDPGRVE